MFVSPRIVAIAALTVAGIGSASAGDAFISATVSGVVAPGVYGQINLGSAPPPPVLYQQPMIIQQPVYGVPQRPIYLYVPPGHAKHWGKHCHEYNACNRPVYFANVDSRGHYVGRGGHESRGYDRGDDGRGGYDRGGYDRGGYDRGGDERGHGHGHGGHGRGHGRD